ncbi:MAG: lytic transglycosylase domain-containing protein [Desulfovibrionales bacterium]|nr:lytic transglycosylase domain-containing protein [Desulfovibrionales bacterium]
MGNFIRCLFFFGSCCALVLGTDQPSQAKGFYYCVKEDGSLCITDIPTSARYKPYKFKRSINYIRNALVAFKRDKRSVEEVNTIVSGLCDKYMVDKKLVMAVIDVESGFNAGAVSSAGAQGLMQIMPETGRDLDLANPFDPSENIDAGIRYLRFLLDTFPDKRLAVAAYNAGPNAVRKYGGIPPYAETQDYVQKVWSRLKHYE